MHILDFVASYEVDYTKGILIQGSDLFSSVFDITEKKTLIESLPMNLVCAQ